MLVTGEAVVGVAVAAACATESREVGLRASCSVLQTVTQTKDQSVSRTRGLVSRSKGRLVSPSVGQLVRQFVNRSKSQTKGQSAGQFESGQTERGFLINPKVGQSV